MKLIIAGKGGCGKSVIAALLAQELARRGNKVLVIDTDESNFGLHSQLGLEKPPDFMDYFGGKKVLFEQVKQLRENWRVAQLPREYLAEKGNIKLMAMGKIYNFGEGCACPINALTSRFLEVLTLENNEFLIADTDAGIEHLGRGVERGADLILAIVEPSAESVKLAQKVIAMAKEIDKPAYYVLNKVTEQTEAPLRAALAEAQTKAEIAAIIPYDERIFARGLEGKELDFQVKGISDLADFLAALRSPA